MSVWRHLTHPDGMTVSLLVTATGLSAEQVRAELRPGAGRQGVA